MIKSKNLIIQGITTLALLVVLSVLLVHSFAVPLLAEDCAAGGCDCECTGLCGANMFLVPYTTVTVFGCRCMDGSEQCSGAYL
jgi:hypothetical protein